MEEYKPQLTDKDGYKAKIRFLPRKRFINSVYDTLKKNHFWLSDEFNRKVEIRKKKELRLEKLNRLNNL